MNPIRTNTVRQYWVMTTSGRKLQVQATDMGEAYKWLDSKLAPDEGFDGPLHRDGDDDDR